MRARFPDARIARLDRDVAARRGATEGVLRALRERRVDVVVGTQMLAKGHDFPGVRLVGVVNADLGLHLPDFRAAERTFQLLTQVAGRAGRGARAGPRDRADASCPTTTRSARSRRHDYETFYREELAQRAALGYPPFGRLARAVLSSDELADATQRGAESLAAAARAAAARAPESAVEVLGPAPAPLARLRGKHRVQLLVKGRARDAVHAVARALAEAAHALPRGVRAQVDAEPYAML